MVDEHSTCLYFEISIRHCRSHVTQCYLFQNNNIPMFHDDILYFEKKNGIKKMNLDLL